jgi:hypothetical protein
MMLMVGGGCWWLVSMVSTHTRTVAGVLFSLPAIFELLPLFVLHLTPEIRVTLRRLTVSHSKITI